MTENIAVIGGGSWATAIVKMLCDNGQQKNVYWWMRNVEAIDSIKKFKRNPNYLSAVELKINPNHISADINYVIQQAQYIVLNVPAAFLKQALKDLSPEAFKGKMVISAIKGIIPESNRVIADYLHENYGIPLTDIAVISGPCHAEEVALEKLSYLTIACKDSTRAAEFAALIQTRYIKTNVSDDIYGTEYAAVLKNIYALASGICHGVGYGDNFQAVLISNAIREIKTFVDAVHPIERDIKESAYLGDLLVTAYSQFSRNRTFGNMIGKGYTITSAQLEMNMVAEGYYAAKCMHLINAEHQVDMPICAAVYAVLYEGMPPAKAMADLAEHLN